MMRWLGHSAGLTTLAAFLLCGLIATLIMLRKEGTFDRPPSSTIVITGNIDLRQSSSDASSDEIERTAEFAHHLSHFRKAGLVMANLLTPMPESGANPLPGKKSHWSAQTESVVLLKRTHVTDVGLANNHAYDFGLPGIVSTKAILDRASIGSTGAAGDAFGAAVPIIRQVSDADDFVRTIAVFPMLDFRKNLDEQYSYYARPNSPGVAEVDVAAFRAAVEDLRREDPQTFVIAYPHWGTTCAWRTPSQRSIARALIEAGADLVVGVGPRVIQEVEYYRGRWIAYGIGTLLGGKHCPKNQGDELVNGSAFIEIAFSPSRPMRPLIDMYILKNDSDGKIAMASAMQVEAAADALRTRRLDRRDLPPLKISRGPRPHLVLE